MSTRPGALEFGHALHGVKRKYGPLKIDAASAGSYENESKMIKNALKMYENVLNMIEHGLENGSYALQSVKLSEALLAAVSTLEQLQEQKVC